MKLCKYAHNPILEPNTENDWEDRCVLNPAVIYDETRKKFIMLYRAAGNDCRHQIKLGLAESDDGVRFTRMSKNPVFEGIHDEPDGGCVEDPRLVKIGDMYYLTYAARAYAPGRYWLEPYVEGVTKAPRYLDETDLYGEESPYFAKENITVSYLAATKNFRVYKKYGRITKPTVDDRDVYLFPEKIGGKYVKISRPKFKESSVKMTSTAERRMHKASAYGIRFKRSAGRRGARFSSKEGLIFMVRSFLSPCDFEFSCGKSVSEDKTVLRKSLSRQERLTKV